MTSVRKRYSRSDRGASAVEFALVLTPLLLLLLAIMQFSVYFWSFQAASNAAREGARAYAVDPCGSGQPALVTQRVGAAADGAVTVTKTFQQAGSKLVPGDSVTVRVTFATYDIAGSFVPVPTTVVKTSTARIEDTEGC